jgi:lysozyme
MKINESGINLIKKFESLQLKAYLCPANIPTIGYGNTLYENGTKVKLGDVITEERADLLLLNVLEGFEKTVDSFTTDNVNSNQFSSLVSFAYNCGNQNLKSSTLLKKVNINPNDISIKEEFLRWNKANGKIFKGLTNRRIEEALLYFKK